MTTIEITSQLKITMLKLLVAGHDIDYAARATQIPRDRVLDIVSGHGYPDHDRMRWAIDILIQNGDRIPVRPVANGHRPGVLLAPPQSAQSAVHRPAPADVRTSARPVHTSTAELLHQAAESEHSRTRGLGTKISGLLADLTARLADEQEAREAKAVAEREAAKTAARIAELEAELAKLKGKRSKPAKRPSGGRTPSTTGQILSESAVIREWARANNIPCPRVGAVGKDVRAAYCAAHETSAVGVA